MKMKWLPETGRPAGATWNPPPPGWIPPTPEELAISKKTFRRGLVEVLAWDGGVPSRARFEDGFEFDPRVCISALVLPSYPDDYKPQHERLRIKDHRNHDLGDEDDNTRWWLSPEWHRKNGLKW